MSGGLPPRLPGDRYDIGDARRVGRLTSAWSAWDRRLERPVVIHLLREDLASDAELAARLVTRLREAARCDHAAVARVYDVIGGDRLGVVLEHTEFDDFRARVSAGSTLSAAETIDVASALADAIDALHELGLTHGGLTLASISETADGRVVINDLGTGGASDAGADETVRGDIAGLAGLVHELVVGRPPHVSGGIVEVDPAVPAAFAGALDDALLHGRFTTAAEFVRSLRTTSQVAEAPASFASERRWLVPVAATLLVGALFVLIGATLGRTETGRNILDNARGAVGLSSQVDDTSPTTTTAITPTTLLDVDVVAPTRLPIARLVDFDPSGDGTESPNRLPLINDGDPTRGWQTERYTTAEFGNLKPGVGLIVEIDEAASISSIVVRSPSRGWAFELYVADTRAPVVSDWGDAVATASSIDADVVIDDVTELTTPGSMLLWITRLDGGPEHRVVVTDIEIWGDPTA